MLTQIVSVLILAGIAIGWRRRAKPNTTKRDPLLAMFDGLEVAPLPLVRPAQRRCVVCDGIMNVVEDWCRSCGRHETEAAMEQRHRREDINRIADSINKPPVTLWSPAPRHTESPAQNSHVFGRTRR